MLLLHLELLRAYHFPPYECKKIPHERGEVSLLLWAFLRLTVSAFVISRRSACFNHLCDHVI